MYIYIKIYIPSTCITLGVSRRNRIRLLRCFEKLQTMCSTIVAIMIPRNAHDNIFRNAAFNFRHASSYNLQTY